MNADNGSAFLEVRRRVAAIPAARKAWAHLKRASARIHYARQYDRFCRLSKELGCPLPARADQIACLNDVGELTFDRHYIYHTAWAARVLARIRPDVHVDVSSSLYFAGIASAFVPMRHYDYRAPDIRLANLEAGFVDLMNLPFLDGSAASLSCMHVVEHVRLGRYGNPLDPQGDAKAACELSRVLATSGQLLFAVPVGRRRVCFNAHRVYGFGQIVEMFSGSTLVEF